MPQPTVAFVHACMCRCLDLGAYMCVSRPFEDMAALLGNGVEADLLAPILVQTNETETHRYYRHAPENPVAAILRLANARSLRGVNTEWSQPELPRCKHNAIAVLQSIVVDCLVSGDIEAAVEKYFERKEEFFAQKDQRDAARRARMDQYYRRPGPH
eukprot:3855693-Rhodomonas_salina.2